jgi:site-specific recombinase XerD
MANMRLKRNLRCFTDQELKKLFSMMEEEKKDCFCRMENAEKGSKQREYTMYNYKKAVRDETFFKLLYFCDFSVSELIVLPLNYYNKNKNELHHKESKNGIRNTLTIKDTDILNLLKNHLEVNKPRKYLFEIEDGKPLTKKEVEWIFPQYCELAEIQNEDKWKWQTLRRTSIRNFILQCQ